MMTEILLPADVLGERLRSARNNAGLTQDAVADALKISRTTLIAIEKGQRKIRHEELCDLARLYGETLHHLLSPVAKHVEFKARFRRRDTASGKQSAATEESVRLLSRLATGAAELEVAVGKPLQMDYPPPVQIRASQVAEQAEDAATSLRQRLGLGLSPIADIISLLELHAGIRIFMRPLSGPVSGVYAFDPDVGACMLINVSRPRVHRLNTVAHECGHFVSDRTITDVLEDDEVPSTIEERFANRFGSALLMPAAGVRNQFAALSEGEDRFSLRQLILLAHMYGVSVQAACLRLEQLGLLPQDTWSSLVDRGLSKTHEHRVLGDPQPEASPSIVPPRLAYLAALAIEQGLLSEAQLCEKLLVDRVELRTLIAPFELPQGA
jgi:Zn-dependent peptidase ImmA (M78 family)/DNA-binding XRE family transcriptional regulator